VKQAAEKLAESAHPDREAITVAGRGAIR